MARNKWGRQEEGGQGGGTSFEDLGYSPFDATRTDENPYEIGDVVIYDGSLYKFTASHTGAWTGTDATATSVEELLKEKADAIKVLTREAQNLTAAEKAQVLANIGAIGEDDTLMTINGTGVKKGDAVTTAETAIVVDGEMSDSSQNPVQNKVVKAYADGKLPIQNDDDTLYVTDLNGYIIAKIDANGVHSVNNEGNDSIAAMVISENLYPYEAVTRDEGGNVTFAKVVFATGVRGTISVTYTNNLSNHVTAVYGSKTVNIDITRDSDGLVSYVSVS